MEFTHNAATNTYTWNMSSPLSGVSSGTILYMVKIPDAAPIGSYIITGDSRWISNLNDLRNEDWTGIGVTTPVPTTILVAATEGNGPCSWISAPEEFMGLGFLPSPPMALLAGESPGDGDGHLEAGEWAVYDYAISDADGIQGYTIYINGVVCDNYVEDVNVAGYIAGHAFSKVTRQADLINTFSIEATDEAGITSTFSLPVYVPTYHYTAWAKGEYNGWSIQAASFEPLSSLTDGGWIVLEGGNPVIMPALETHYNGPVINKQKFSAIADLPYASRFGLGGISGIGGATVNVTPRSDVVMPMSTYPIYREGDSASATFYGTMDMNGGQQFHVVLIDTTGIARPITMADITNAVNQADICTNGSGDFTVNSAIFPALGSLNEGYYALLVLDYRLPGIPCLVAAAPIVVTKSDLVVTKVGTDLPMPGDPLTYTLNMPVTTPGMEYMYFMAMVPQGDYRGALNITSDGTLAGTALSMNGFTVREDITVSPDGRTVTIQGINGTYTFDSADIRDISSMKSMLMQEFSAANVSIANSSLTTLATVDLTLPTKATMPAGKYMLMSLVLENSTGKIAAFNQTTVDLGMTYDIPLYQGWNLVSLPVKPVNSSLLAVITPDLMDNLTVVWGYNSSNVTSEWRYYTTLGDPYIQGNLSEINEKLGYWFLVENNTTLHVTGTIPDTSDVTLINPGWSLVGNPTIDTRNVRDVYTTSFVVWEYTGQTTTWDYWCSDADNPSSIYIQGTLTTLKPTYGYWVLI